MKKLTIIGFLLITIFASTGCISRTTDRPPTLSERTRGGGRVQETKLLWIWQDEFWNKQ